MRYKRSSPNPEPLGLILSKSIKRLGMEKRLKGEKALMSWENVVGPKIASNARAVKFFNSKLLVEVENPSWRNELIFMKEKIIKELNKNINSRIVKDIIFINKSGKASKLETSS
jgi:predicted nucleic acid-binding Zn ribbon protein